MAQRGSGRGATSPTVVGGAPPRATVGVTGAASGLGRIVAGHLAASGCQVRGIDLLDGSLDGASPSIDWVEADVREPSISDHLTGLDAVVHLALSTVPDAPVQARRDLNVRGTHTLLSAAAALQVPHVVLVTSAAVFGAVAGGVTPIDDDAPLRAESDGLISDLLEIEAVVERARALHPGTRFTVVRPATLVGADPDSLAIRHFASPRLLVLRGEEMRWQFAHADDVATAIECVIRGDVDHDAVTVGSEGWLAQYDVEQVTGRRSLELPASVAFATAERLHRAGLSPVPASELAFVVYPWVITSARLRQAGWRPQHDNLSALQALVANIPGPSLAGRRIGRSEAVAGAGAAGATVAAVLGAAAFVRTARRARGL